MNGPRTIGGLFESLVDRGAERPVLTFYDDATAERTELSGATLRNWVAKTANMLVDDLDLRPGQWAAVGLPPHWQTAAVLLACWTVGLAVTMSPDPAEVAFVAARAPSDQPGAPVEWPAADEWPAVERYVLGLHPMGLPLATVPPGYLDYPTEIRVHGDAFSTRDPVGPDTPALRWTEDAVTHEGTQAMLCGRAAERATTMGIPYAARVLVDADALPDPVDWLLAPLSAAATVVLCVNTDVARLDARVAAERVDAVIRERRA
ncbi:MAG TPA: TIGR03089 family protein [Micromonosporaceae bacterium]|nr:TIGR03089 family protein [Micromonosporaceae bacterium]